MRKIIKILLLFLVCVPLINATTHSKKTFLMPRAQGVNSAMEISTWHNHIMNAPQNSKNSHIQATLFDQAAIKGADVGKYFGIGNDRNYFKIGNIANAGVEIDYGYLIHDIAGGDPASGTVVLNPKQEVLGVRLDFVQFMQHPFKNTYLKINLPFVRVDNNTHFKVDNNIANSNGYSIDNFFRGVYRSPVGDPLLFTNAQQALTYAKFGGRRSLTGIADIDVAYGYKLIDNEKKHLFLNLGVTIPTGSKPKGEYIWEPVYGNGDHVAIGAGVDASTRLWKKERHSGKLVFTADYRYLFKGSEKRTIPLNKLSYPFAHYYLFGKDGSPANTALIPGANLLTRKVSIRPGSQLDTSIALSFNSKRFIIDAGYNLFLREGEAIRLKEQWTDNLYGIAREGFDTTNQFTIAANALNGTAINYSDLNLSGASTPSQITNKAFAAIGYKFNLKEYPTSISFGASYEFAESNQELEGYTFWGKFGISF